MNKKLIEDLDDLSHRLQLDYAGDKKFEQYEEDRLAVINAIDELEILEIIKKHLKVCGLSISCFIGGNRYYKPTYEPRFEKLKEWLEND